MCAMHARMLGFAYVPLRETRTTGAAWFVDKSEIHPCVSGFWDSLLILVGSWTPHKLAGQSVCAPTAPFGAWKEKEICSGKQPQEVEFLLANKSSGDQSLVHTRVLHNRSQQTCRPAVYISAFPLLLVGCDCKRAWTQITRTCPNKDEQTFGRGTPKLRQGTRNGPWSLQRIPVC